MDLTTTIEEDNQVVTLRIGSNDTIYGRIKFENYNHKLFVQGQLDEIKQKIKDKKFEFNPQEDVLIIDTYECIDREETKQYEQLKIKFYNDAIVFLSYSRMNIPRFHLGHVYKKYDCVNMFLAVQINHNNNAAEVLKFLDYLTEEINNNTDKLYTVDFQGKLQILRVM